MFPVRGSPRPWRRTELAATSPDRALDHGLGVVTCFAIARPSRDVVRAVAAATVVAQVAHVVYHVTHLSALPDQSDRVLQTIVLAIVLLIPLLVLIAAREIDDEPATPRQLGSMMVKTRRTASDSRAASRPRSCLQRDDRLAAAKR